MSYRWVRFNAITGAILDTLKVSDDSIKKDTNGYDEVKIDLPAYGLSGADRLQWAEKYFVPWAIGIAKLNDDTNTCEAGGIIIKREFSGMAEEIGLTGYNLMEYIKKLRIPNQHANITANSDLVLSGATYGELYAEAIRAGIDATGAPAGTTYYQNIILPAKTGSTVTRTIPARNQPTVFDFITKLRDGEETKGEEVRFNLELDVANSRMVWVMEAGTETVPHINTDVRLTASTMTESGSGSATWKVADYTWDDDATTAYNRLLIDGSTNDEAPFVGVRSVTGPGKPTLTEAFDSGTDLNSDQMDTQLATRLTGSMATRKNIQVIIEEDFTGFWKDKVGCMLTVQSGEKTAGAGVYGRVMELSSSSSEPGRFELSLAPEAARYPKLPSQKEREDIGGQGPGIGGGSGTGGFDTPDMPDLGGGFGGSAGDGVPDIGNPDLPDFEEGGYVPPVTVSGTVYDANAYPFSAVTVRAFSDEAMTTEVSSARTGMDGTYQVSVTPDKPYWLTASFGSFTEPHPQNPITVEEDSIEGVDFMMSITNPLKMWHVTGQIRTETDEPVPNKQFYVMSGYWWSNASIQGTYYLTSFTTDQDGLFSVWLPNGSYNIASAIGTEGYNTDAPFFPFQVEGKDKNLGEIVAYASFRGVSVEVRLSGLAIPHAKVEVFADAAHQNKLGEAWTIQPAGSNNGAAGTAFITLPPTVTQLVHVKATYGGSSAYGSLLPGSSTSLHISAKNENLALHKVSGKMMLATPNTQFYVMSGYWWSNASIQGTYYLTSFTTDQDGLFSVWLPDGTYNLSSIASAGYNEPFRPFTVSGEDVDLGEVDPVYNPGVSVAVQVAGVALPQVKVEVFSDATYQTKLGESWTIQPAGANNGAAGTAYVPLPQGTTGTVYARATYGTSTNTGSVTVGSTATILISHPTFTVSGTMYEADGVTPSVSRPVTFNYETIKVKQDNTYQSLSITTDSAGKFLASLPAGSRWTVRGDNNTSTNGALNGTTQAVQIVADQDIPNLNLRVVTPANRFVIAAHVVTGGIHAEGATVRFYSDPAFTVKLSEYTYTMNTNGPPGNFQAVTAVFNSAEVSTVYVEAEKGGVKVRGQVRWVNTGWHDITLHVTENVVVAGTMVEADGVTPSVSRPVTFNYETIKVRGDSTFPQGSITTDNAGRFLTSLPAGVRWTVRGDNSTSTNGDLNGSTQTVQFSGDQNVTDLLLKATTSTNRFVVGVYVLTGGIPVEGATVRFYSDAGYTNKVGEYIYSTNTNSTLGNYPSVIAVFDSTQYPSLYVEGEKNGIKDRKRVARTNTQMQMVNLNLAETFTISGKVTDGTNPIPDITVTAYGTSHTIPTVNSVVTAADGSYSIALPAGKYRLVPTLPSTAKRKSEIVELVDGHLLLDFVAAPDGANIQGNVLINNTFVPMGWDAEVRLYSDAGFTTQVASTKLHGALSTAYSWQITDAPANIPLWVRVRYAGLDFTPANPAITATAPGASKNAPTINIDRIEFPVDGRVVNLDGSAVTTAQTIRFFNNSSYQYTFKTVTTAANGTYSTTLPAGTYYIRGVTISPVATESFEVSGMTVAPDAVVSGEAPDNFKTISLTVTTGGMVRGGLEVTAEDETGTVVAKTTSNTLVATGNAVLYAPPSATRWAVKSEQFTRTGDIISTVASVQATVEVPA